MNMKKILLIVIVLSVVALSMIGIKSTTEKHNKFSNLILENVEALAWEIDVVFCAQVNIELCYLDSDGYFVMGHRQYG
jgi:hypothetical protein